MDEFFNSNTIKSTKGTNNEKGTGLGLSLCKELTDMNNATLLFTKNKEIGSCFSIIGKTS